MKKILTVVFALTAYLNVNAQNEFCNLLPTIIQDGKTYFDKAKGKLISEAGNVKTFEALYKVDGRQFGIVRTSKEAGTILSEICAKYNTKEEAEAGLDEYVKAYNCSSSFKLVRRKLQYGQLYRYAEYFMASGKGFYQTNIFFRVDKIENAFYIIFEAHTQDRRLYMPITEPKRDSEFAKSLFNALEKAKEGMDKLKGAERKMPESSESHKFYETSLKFPQADCYVEYDDNWMGTDKTLVSSFSAGKTLDKARLETLYAECHSQIKAALGNEQYYYVEEEGGYTIYYTYDQIGFGRGGKLLTLHKDESKNTVSISIDLSY